ncbi:sulfurtransferase [Salinarimonas ramus]|uniref:Sulfurtransferase n=1 Tax=Salinarimonas ramus TaxID=690164 RepID=A0A917QBJ1_9HYPH|nr:rhodanese-like domain-containing protein [Salinarimonas ramus]GGK41607.1 sulfurtransferase [Salinarimonas ramus]
MTAHSTTLAAAALGLSLAAGIALATPASAQEGWDKLVDPTKLVALEETADPVVLDIRAAAAFAEGHIPGAVNAPYTQWRGPTGNPGALPEPALLSVLVGESGIDETTPVVIVHQGADSSDFGSAARVYWTLKSLGVERIAILDGGVRGWVAAGNALSTEPVRPDPTIFDAVLSDEWRASVEEIETSIESGDARLVDARPAPFFLGELWHGAAARPGTLPTAENFSHAAWFVDDGPLVVDEERARAIAQSAGLADGATLVSFCNTGHWAATNWFALSELAGIEGVKLYPESVVEWSNTGRALDNEPGRVEWLLMSTRQWLADVL